MALLFSAVTVTANDQEVEFLVGGIPREFDDLEGWTSFDNFMEDIDEETESCHLSEHCNRTVCMRPKKEINQLKKSMKDLIMK